MRMEPLVVNVEAIHSSSAGARGASARRELTGGIFPRPFSPERNPCYSILGPCVQPCLA
jgi:hypothetical protein